VVTYSHVKNLVDQNTTNEEKPASLASTFRGAALQWLTQQLCDNSDLLRYYNEFVDRVRASFGLTETAKLSQASRKYTNCHQKASVELYALEFKQLLTQLGIADITAVAQFQNGLKTQLREALIVKGGLIVYQRY
jgi:hypothetical protein